MALVCKKCGYKQTDVETIISAKTKFPNMEEHDIPYYCGACMDNATEEEYSMMEKETSGVNNSKLLVINTYRGLVDSVFSNFEFPEDVVIVVQDCEEDSDPIPTETMNRLV